MSQRPTHLFIADPDQVRRNAQRARIAYMRYLRKLIRPTLSRLCLGTLTRYLVSLRRSLAS